jgi:dihydroorotate dehydrogenase (fumarate)
MDLSTTYLGMRLPHPVMPGASPLADDLDTIRRLEDAGAAAIVLRSLFQEQIEQEQLGALTYLDSHSDTSAEALSYFADSDVYGAGPERYLDHLSRIKRSVTVPVIASLNGINPGGWVQYARMMEQAGADALELNLYFIATQRCESAAVVEDRSVAVVRAVRSAVRIPIAVKLSPFFSALPHFVGELEGAGADGVVLFNRFYQPDIDVESLGVERKLHLSHPSELLLRIHWLAILSGQTRLSLAATGGAHSALDVLKAVMAGAHAVQMVSALLDCGPGHLTRVVKDITEWLEEHEYESLEQARGSMNAARTPDPLAYERANYIHLLQSWTRPAPLRTT